MVNSPHSDYDIRYTTEEDAPFLRDWLVQGDVLRWFPMSNEQEIDDSVRHWISYSKLFCSLTVTYQGVPCGLSTLYLMPYRKVQHHCLFSIIVAQEHRGRGVGSYLLNNIVALAKNQFRLEALYLEVYQGNPAIKLYQRFGFKEVGVHPKFIKEADGTYIDKILMEREL